VDFELGPCGAERGEGGNRGNFSGTQIQAWSLVNVAEWKFDGVASEIRRNVFERVNDALAGFPVDFLELCKPSCKPLVIGNQSRSLSSVG
jgi:hypothetical protein